MVCIEKFDRLERPQKLDAMALRHDLSAALAGFRTAKFCLERQGANVAAAGELLKASVERVEEVIASLDRKIEPDQRSEMRKLVELLFS